LLCSVYIVDAEDRGITHSGRYTIDLSADPSAPCTHRDLQPQQSAAAAARISRGPHLGRSPISSSAKQRDGDPTRF